MDTFGIGVGVFEGCSSLTSIEIPDNVTYIGRNAFKACPLISSIVIPESVKTIGSSAFSGCTAVIKFEGKEVPENDFINSIFYGYSGACIIVPTGCGNAYKEAFVFMKDKIVEE